MPINCAALTESLLESELFGHEKGAFTGATAQRKGKIEAAAGGTLFLDEAGEMSLRLQAMLLRAIEEKEFERVGGTQTIEADVRFVVATNRNLEEAIKEGRFREDLYHRLNVFSITMRPPDLIRPEDLHETVRERQEPISGKMKSYLDGVNDAKRSMIDQAMEMTGGNHQEAAKLLDTTLSYFYRLIRTLYVKRDT